MVNQRGQVGLEREIRERDSNFLESSVLLSTAKQMIS